MKIIVAGIGKIGETLVAQLCGEGYELTVIDKNRAVIDRVVGCYDVMGVLGNCASMDTLARAGVGKADLLIAATGSDEVNLLCSVTAHGMNPELPTASRISNPEYTAQADRLPRTLGLSMTFRPEKLAADEIANLLRFPGFLKREMFARGRAELVELRVESDSKLCGIALRDLQSVVRARVLICTVLRDGVAIIPDGRFVLNAGDRIFVTAPRNSLAAMLKNLGILPRRAHNVIVVGGGRIVYPLVEELAADGIHIKIVEKDPAVCEVLAANLAGVEVVCADIDRKSVLEEEGIASCDALITLTGMDEQNMIISLYGEKFNVPQIITKLGKADDAQIEDSLPLGSVISPRRLCCNSIVRFVRALSLQNGGALTVHSFAGGGAEASEFLVDEDTPHCGEPLRALSLRKNVLISSITRKGLTQIPDGNSSYQPGDSVVVVSGTEMPVMSLEEIFCD